MVDQSRTEETIQDYLEDIQQVLSEDEQIWGTHSQNSQAINPIVQGERRHKMVGHNPTRNEECWA